MSTSINKKLKNLDFYLFICLIILTISGQIQHRYPIFYSIRLLLLFYLYCRLILVYRPLKTTGQLYIWLYIVLSCFVCLNTYILLSDNTYTVSAFMRFINVTLFAPLASVIIRDDRQIKLLFKCLFILCTINFIILLIQFLGFNFNEYIGSDYIANRQNLSRFQSLMGNPNATAITFAVLFPAVFIINMKIINRVFLIIIFLLAQILLLSTSGFVLIFTGLLLVCLLFYRKLIKNYFILKIIYSSVIIVFFSVIIYFYIPNEKKEILNKYVEVFSTKLIVDKEEGLDDTSYTEHDLSFRLFGSITDGLVNGEILTHSYLYSLIVGSGFGVAGSVAVEKNIMTGYGGVSILAHNSICEIFIVGGLILLFSFCLILLTSYLKLFNLQKKLITYKLIFIIFLLLCMVLPIYPAFNQISVGCVFWLIIGITSNNTLLRSFQKNSKLFRE